jgi:hypothetical protein
MLTPPDLNKPAFLLCSSSARLVRDGKCPTCAKAIKESDFRKELDKKEYSISGMCQECIDETFGVKTNV